MTILQDFIDLDDRDHIDAAAADLELAVARAVVLSATLREMARDRWGDGRGRMSWAHEPLETAANMNDDYVVSYLKDALKSAEEALSIVDPDPEPDMPIVCETRKVL